MVEKVSDALAEYEGIYKGVSTRTVQGDIQQMRSDKLGYNAPIVVTDKKFYSYSDAEFSITNNPLSKGDLDKLTEVVDILQHFKGFSHFQEMIGMIHRLEDKVSKAKGKGKSIVHLETNEKLRGIEFLDEIYQSIKNKQVLSLTYQSFKARTPNVFSFHGYLLKEYRNRWFVVGRKSKTEPLVTFAVDRIKELKIESKATYIENHEFDADEYYKDVIGVTVNEGNRPQLVHLAIDQSNAPYVITKPLHHTQKVISNSSAGIEITIEVILNLELEREILGFGDSMVVMSPKRLRETIERKLHIATKKYLSKPKQ